MLLRTLTALLLMAVLALTTMGQSSIEQEEAPPRPAVEEQLTPEEEREARALAEEFIARLERAEDVTPLLRDLYISDFAERLQRDDMGNLFPLALTREVAAEATPAEIRRLYAASINFLYLSMRLYIAAHLKRKQQPRAKGAPQAGEEEEDIMLEEIIPPSVIKLIKSDPLLARSWEKELKEEAARRAAAQETGERGASAEPAQAAESVEPHSFDDLMPFKSIERMRHYLSLTEQGLELIRQHLKTLPPELTPSVKDFYLKQLKESEGKDEAKTFLPKFVPGLQTNILDSEYMGYPKGTRLICAQALLHIEMIRTPDGTLKIVKVELLIE